MFLEQLLSRGSVEEIEPKFIFQRRTKHIWHGSGFGVGSGRHGQVGCLVTRSRDQTWGLRGGAPACWVPAFRLWSLFATDARGDG